MRRIQPVVLFVLGRMAARVIRRNDDHAAVDTGIAHRENRVSCNVHADMFHRDQCSGSADGSAGNQFSRRLLIAGPFAIDLILILNYIFQDLC